MIEMFGDFWTEAKNQYKPYNALVCTTNLIVKQNKRLVMGAGIAKQFRDNYQYADLDLLWGTRILNNLHEDGFMVNRAPIPSSNLYLVAFPTKVNWRDKSEIDLIVKSTLNLVKTANILGWKKILMTRPGCQNGGLNWPFVKEKIGRYLDDKFVIIERNK